MPGVDTHLTLVFQWQGAGLGSVAPYLMPTILNQYKNYNSGNTR